MVNTCPVSTLVDDPPIPLAPLGVYALLTVLPGLLPGVGHFDQSNSGRKRGRWRHVPDKFSSALYISECQDAGRSGGISVGESGKICPGGCEVNADPSAGGHSLASTIFTKAPLVDSNISGFPAISFFM